MDKQFVAVIGLGYVGLPLSLQFARSGVEVLGLDVDPSKIETVGAGERMPIASNKTEEGRAQNRRVEVLVLGRVK